MSFTEDAVRAELAQLLDPDTGLDLISANAVRAVGIDGRNVALALQWAYPAKSAQPALIEAIQARLRERLGAQAVSVEIQTRIPAHKVQKELSPLPGVKNIIAVASGKGGVGKSTTAANLALALAAEGATVGILDADIHGPSIPMMLGISGKPDSLDGKTVEPKIAYGLQAMSIGLFLGEDTPTIWRGPMTTQYLQQLLTTTRWQDLDYLIIDLPPGTGDIQLTLAQRIPVSAALIVTTPQDIALIDAKKALKMFEKVEVPVLGIVENMAVHICPNCGHADAIFGEGGGARMAEQYGTELLGQLPLQRAIREQMDAGTPTVAAAPDSPAAASYRAIARKAAAKLSRQARNKSIGFPNIVIQNS
ncbi:MAG: iron-sulfur cluster carrier protein ApbC [Arenimonas sp.]|nr:iron-sulfur cluster carrier protein ApbC [Arenimonas sp.]